MWRSTASSLRPRRWLEQGGAWAHGPHRGAASSDRTTPIGLKSQQSESLHSQENNHPQQSPPVERQKDTAEQTHAEVPTFYTKASNTKCHQRKVLESLTKDPDDKIFYRQPSEGRHRMLRPEHFESSQQQNYYAIRNLIVFGSAISMGVMYCTKRYASDSKLVTAQSMDYGSDSVTDRSHPSMDSLIRIVVDNDILDQNTTMTATEMTVTDTTPSDAPIKKKDEDLSKELMEKGQDLALQQQVNHTNMMHDSSKGWKEQQPQQQQQQQQRKRRTASSLPRKLIVDQDEDFDPLAEVYRKELRIAKELNRKVEEEKREKQFDNKKEERAVKFLNTLMMTTTDPGDQNVRFRENKRLATRFQPTIAKPRTASRIEIGVAQVFQEKTQSDRFGFGIIKAHQTKFFYTGLMDGYNGWQMAEYIRQALPERLEQFIQQSPLFLIRDSITAAFVQLENELKEAVKEAKELKLLKPLSMGSCVLLSLIDTNSIIIANLGTSKAVISREGKTFRLCQWHSASTLFEQRRLIKAVQREDNALKCSTQREVLRKVQNLLSIPFWLSGTLGYDTMHLDCLVKGMSPATRSLGHFQLKDPEVGQLFSEMEGSRYYPYISPYPSVYVYPRTKYDEFLILATNGFWEAVEELEAVAIVHETIRDLRAAAPDTPARPDIAAEPDIVARPRRYSQAAANRLMKEALQNHQALHARDIVLGERQDMTVIVIPLTTTDDSIIPDLNREVLQREKNIPFWMKLKRYFVRYSEDIFKIADWRTKLRWQYERHLSDDEKTVNERSNEERTARGSVGS